MKEHVAKHISMKAWGIFILANLLAIWAWSKLGTDISNNYRLFPLLGLIAFSTMWGHYVVWALRIWSGADENGVHLYSKITHYVVLVAMLLHPLLLINQLKSDGLGNPPDSYIAYVGKASVGFVYLGTLCLLAFLAFEFKKWLQSKAIVWKVIMILNHIAMLGIVLHAMKIGNSVRQAPLRYIWPFYGLSLIVIYLYLASKKKLV